jgi:hypothetical protein
MFPVPRRKKVQSDITGNLEEAILKVIAKQNNIREMARRVNAGSNMGDDYLKRHLLKEMDSLFLAYRDADKIMQIQEKLQGKNNYPRAIWKRRLRDLELKLAIKPGIIKDILLLLDGRIESVLDQQIPIITPEDIHRSIAIAIVGDAGEMYEPGYFQQFV